MLVIHEWAAALWNHHCTPYVSPSIKVCQTQSLIKRLHVQLHSVLKYIIDIEKRYTPLEGGFLKKKHRFWQTVTKTLQIIGRCDWLFCENSAVHLLFLAIMAAVINFTLLVSQFRNASCQIRVLVTVLSSSLEVPVEQAASLHDVHHTYYVTVPLNPACTMHVASPPTFINVTTITSLIPSLRHCGMSLKSVPHRCKLFLRSKRMCPAGVLIGAIDSASIFLFRYAGRCRRHVTMFCRQISTHLMGVARALASGHSREFIWWQLSCNMPTGAYHFVL